MEVQCVSVDGVFSLIQGKQLVVDGEGGMLWNASMWKLLLKLFVKPR